MLAIVSATRRRTCVPSIRRSAKPRFWHHFGARRPFRRGPSHHVHPHSAGCEDVCGTEETWGFLSIQPNRGEHLRSTRPDIGRLRRGRSLGIRRCELLRRQPCARNAQAKYSGALPRRLWSPLLKRAEHRVCTFSPKTPAPWVGRTQPRGELKLTTTFTTGTVNPEPFDSSPVADSLRRATPKAEDPSGMVTPHYQIGELPGTTALRVDVRAPLPYPLLFRLRIPSLSDHISIERRQTTCVRSTMPRISPDELSHAGKTGAGLGIPDIGPTTLGTIYRRPQLTTQTLLLTTGFGHSRAHSLSGVQVLPKDVDQLPAPPAATRKGHALEIPSYSALELMRK